MKRVLFFIVMVGLAAGVYGQESKSTLKTLFQTGARPTGANFASLIDASYNDVTSGVWSLAGGYAISVSPYSTKQAGKWYTYVTAPSDTTIKLKFDGIIDASNLRVAGVDVLTTYTTQWTTSGSNVYRLNGNVGIGTASPSYKFHVVGTSHFDGPVVVEDEALQLSATIGSVYMAASGGQLYFHDGTAGTITLNTLKAGATNYFTQTLTNIYPTSTGDNLLIGTTTQPLGGAYDLAAPGTVFLGATTFGGNVGFYTGTFRLYAGGAVNEFSTDGTFTGNSDLAVPTEKATKAYVDNIWAPSGTTKFYNSTDSFGIGTATVTNKLSISGNANFVGTADKLYFGTSNYLGRVSTNAMRWNVGGNDAVSIRSNGSGTDTIDLSGDVFRWNGTNVLTGSPSGVNLASLPSGSVLYEAGDSIMGISTFLWDGTYVLTGTDSLSTRAYARSNAKSASVTNIADQQVLFKDGDTISGSTTLTWDGVSLTVMDVGNNTFVGDNMVGPTTAQDNVGIGNNALNGITEGINNVAVGANAGLLLTEAQNSVLLGTYAGQAITTGSGSVMVGTNAGYSNNSDNNVFMGFASGYTTTTGFSNTFLGTSSGYSNTTGYHNVFVGDSAGYSNTNASGNVYIGVKVAGKFNDGENTAVGYYALGDASGGSYNAVYGMQSGYSNTTGTKNTYLGTYAGYAGGTGSSNVAIGYDAGRNVGSGNSNIFIGYQAGSSETGSNKLYIENSSSTAPLIEGDFAGDSVTINGKLTVVGDMIYNFRHAIGSADSVALSIGGTANRYYKIATGGAFTWRESDGITTAADSARILVAGDYKVHVWIAATTSNASDKIRIKLYDNGVANPTSLGRFIVNSQGTGNAESQYYMWYKTFAANDYLSIWLANISASRAVAITDIKIYIEKVPEN